MSLFIRCEWVAADAHPIQQQIADVIRVLSDPTLIRIAGEQWFSLGRSRKDALSKPVVTKELYDLTKWRRVPMIGGQMYYGLDLWNGHDHPQAANISIVVNSPPGLTNTFLISGLDLPFLSSKVSWDDVLLCAKSAAQTLGGFALVSSNELIDYAQRLQLPSADSAAYASFWEIDPSGKNPHFSALKKDKSLPFNIVVCDSWQVHAPDRNRLIELINFLNHAKGTH